MTRGELVEAQTRRTSTADLMCVVHQDGCTDAFVAEEHLGCRLGDDCEKVARSGLVELDDRDPADWTASIGTWFLDCPGQSPAWSHYTLNGIHLRPIDGGKPAVVRVPGATHEVLLLALDPGTPPVAADPKSWHFLQPYNVMEQVALPDDKAAVELLELAAVAIVNGVLPAEPALAGAVEPWRSSLIKTAAHLRGEEHAP